MNGGPAPSRTQVVLRRLALIGIGYCVAVVVATFATIVHLTLPTVLPDEGRFGSFYSMMSDWPMLFLAGLTITATAALPGFVVIMLVAVWAKWQGAMRFTLAGGVNAVFAVWLQLGFGATEPYMLFACIGGGLAGGLSYWFTAERWRDAAPQRACADKIFSANAENTPANR